MFVLIWADPSDIQLYPYSCRTLLLKLEIYTGKLIITENLAYYHPGPSKLILFLPLPSNLHFVDLFS
jgi:hypothetical protein